MTYKNIYAAHEVRMWITNIIIPTVIGVAVLNYTHPEIKQGIKDKINEFKMKHSKDRFA